MKCNDLMRSDKSLSHTAADQSELELLLLCDGDSDVTNTKNRH